LSLNLEAPIRALGEEIGGAPLDGCIRIDADGFQGAPEQR